jgi:hypothetical protein
MNRYVAIACYCAGMLVADVTTVATGWNGPGYLVLPMDALAAVIFVALAASSRRLA